MEVSKHLRAYEKISYSLILQSFFLFLIIPGSYLLFLSAINLQGEIQNTSLLFIKFNNPRFFYIDIKYVYYSKTLAEFLCYVFSGTLLLILLVNYHVKLDQKKIISLYIPLYRISWPIIKYSNILSILLLVFFVVILINNIFPKIPIRWWSIIIFFGAIGGGLYAFGSILELIVKFDEKKYHYTIGKKVTKKDQPNLFNLIEEGSKKIKSIFPDNVILGSEASFYVTSSDICLVSKGSTEILNGKTLYIPLVFLKILTKDELAGIIGHELAHFSGEDLEYAEQFNSTVFSLKEKFISFDKSFEEARKDLGTGFYGAVALSITKLFLVILLNPISYIFINLIKKDSKIGINQEIRADKIGSRLCKNKKSFITGLCKFSIFSQVYYSIYNDFINDLKNQNNKSLSTRFGVDYKNYLINSNVKNDLKKIMAYQMAHPSDTHPPIKDRMKNLKIDIKDISKNDLIKTKPSAAELINNFNDIDKLLLLNG